MGPLQPSLGLFLWSLIIFLGLFFILRKMAWGPILQAIKSREESIENSLQEAQKARDEMANLKSENERLLAEARAEREAMLKEARETGDKILSESKAKADAEYQRTVERAREDIRAEKNAALAEIKGEVGRLSIEIAEKVLRQELSDPKAQAQVVDKLVSELNLN